MSEDTKDLASRAYLGLSIAFLSGAAAFALHTVLAMAGVL